MRRCPGDGDEQTRVCVHSRIYRPLRIVWAAVDAQWQSRPVRDWWEKGFAEPWARSVLKLMEGYVWAGDEVLWHAQRHDDDSGLWRIVVSRAVRRPPVKKVT